MWCLSLCVAMQCCADSNIHARKVLGKFQYRNQEQTKKVSVVGGKVFG